MHRLESLLSSMLVKMRYICKVRGQSEDFSTWLRRAINTKGYLICTTLTEVEEIEVSVCIWNFDFGVFGSINEYHIMLACKLTKMSESSQRRACRLESTWSGLIFGPILSLTLSDSIASK